MTKKWKFYNPKFLCKCFILKKINSPNCLKYFINIFVDKNNFLFIINKKLMMTLIIKLIRIQMIYQLMKIKIKI